MLKTVTQTLVTTTTSGDWIITKYSNGLMTLDLNTDISTNTLIMTGTTTAASGTITLPQSFINSSFVATANIFFNGADNFLAVDSPIITVRPRTASTVGYAARRSGTVGVDGYYYSLHCVGLWK